MALLGRRAARLALATTVILLSAAASAAAAPDPLFGDDFEESEEAGANGVHDPLEPYNRFMFGLNRRIDWLLWDPATRIYRVLVPAPGRDGIHRVFMNLNSSSVLVNQILQLRLVGAAKTVGRLVLNTTIGWGGIFDVAVEAGWEPQRADFGETMALAGLPSGPYMVLPLFGPSSIRDGVGVIVDQFLQPTLYILGPLPHIFVGTGFGLSVREEVADEVKILRESSVDFYSVLRSAYWQNREAYLEASLGGGESGE